MVYTTLNKIKEYRPCSGGWEKLLNYLGKKQADDKRLYFKTILKSNGIKDAIWALRTLDYKDFCLFSADVAESTLHLYETKYPDDDRPRKAIEAIRDYRDGLIDADALNLACDAAYAAYYDCDDSDAAKYADYAATAANAGHPDDAAFTGDAKKWNKNLFVKHFC